MRSRTRRLLLAASAFALLVLLVAAAAWFIATGALEAGITRWADARQRDGLTVAWDGMERTGFPFAARVRVRGPRIAAPQGGLPLREWRGDSLDVAFTLFAPRRVTITTSGRHVLSIADGGETIEFLADVDGLAITLSTGNRFPATGEAVLAGVTLRDSTGRQVLRGTGADVRLDRPRDDEASLILSLESLDIPVLPETRLGRRLGPIDARIMLAGVPPQDISADALTRWRDAGGRIVIERLHMEWGTLAGDVTGRLVLDRRLQPAGRLEARLAGLRDAIRAARDAGVIDDGTATLLRLTLSAFTTGPATLPLIVENRRVTAGPVTLFRLPKVRWP